MDEQSLRAALSGLIGGRIPDVRYFDVIGSSNDAALAWIEEGAADGCLVAADMQTDGRGRMGRRWITNSGTALAFSLILRPDATEQKHIGLLSPLGALAVAHGLETEYRLAPEIKWPNDVLVHGHKLCGILLEAAWKGEQLQGVVIGIGLNVARAAVPPAETLLFPATSLEEALGYLPEREPLLNVILTRLFAWRAQLAEEVFLQAWQQRLAFKGKWVRVDQPGKPAVDGKVLGVAPGGALRLQTTSGEVCEVSVGDVHLRPAGEVH